MSHVKKVAGIKLPDVQQEHKQVHRHDFPVFSLVEMGPEVVPKAALQQAPTQVGHQGDVKEHQLENSKQKRYAAL